LSNIDILSFKLLYHLSINLLVFMMKIIYLIFDLVNQTNEFPVLSTKSVIAKLGTATYCLRCFFLCVSACLTICLISLINRSNAYFKWFTYWSTTTRWQDKANWSNSTLPANPSANGSTVRATLLSFAAVTIISNSPVCESTPVKTHWPLAHCCQKIKLLVLFRFLFLHHHSC
jgi:hypothetical protein